MAVAAETSRVPQREEDVLSLGAASDTAVTAARGGLQDGPQRPTGSVPDAMRWWL